MVPPKSSGSTAYAVWPPFCKLWYCIALISAGDRAKEANEINKSLSNLSNCIMALANKDKHVPFRNSKLTHYLEPFLGGDAKALMFVNVASEPQSFNESLCSLRFAQKVNACEIGTARRGVKIGGA